MSEKIGLRVPSPFATCVVCESLQDFLAAVSVQFGLWANRVLEVKGFNDDVRHGSVNLPVPQGSQSHTCKPATASACQSGYFVAEMSVKSVSTEGQPQEHRDNAVPVTTDADLTYPITEQLLIFLRNSSVAISVTCFRLRCPR